MNHCSSRAVESIRSEVVQYSGSQPGTQRRLCYFTAFSLFRILSANDCDRQLNAWRLAWACMGLHGDPSYLVDRRPDDVGCSLVADIHRHRQEDEQSDVKQVPAWRAVNENERMLPE